MQKANIRLVNKPDRVILSQLVNRQVTSFKTVGSKGIKELPKIEPGGLYDPFIFGSDKKCRCGRLRRPGTCPICNTTVMTTDSYKNIKAYYKAAIPWINPIAIKDFKTKLWKNNPTIAKKIAACNDGQSGLDAVWGTVFKYTNEPTDITVEYGGESLYLEIEEIEEDSDMPSIGLIPLKQLGKQKAKVNGEDCSWMDDMINCVLEISSPYYRPWRVFDHDQKVYQHESTVLYSAFIQLQEHLNYSNVNSAIFKHHISGLVPGETADINSIEFAAMCYGLQHFLAKIYDRSPLKATSKESLIRNIYQQRIVKTARTNISVDPELDIDTSNVPISLFYYACKKAITDRLKSLHEDDPEYDANAVYDSFDDEVKHVTEQLAEEGCVIMERPPTLHRYNTMAFKIKLHEGITYYIPPLVCEPFNADIDRQAVA